MNHTEPITLNPTQLEEELVQEAIGWMEAKNTEELQDIIRLAKTQPEAYAPEILEAVQRILGEREQLSYTKTKGQKVKEKGPKVKEIFEQKVQVKFLNGRIQDFQSHAELRRTILEGEIPKETLVKEKQILGERLGYQEPTSEQSWESLESYARSHFSLAMLYAPLRYFIMMGMFLGFLAGSLKYPQPLVFPTHTLENMPHFLGNMSFIVLGLVFLGLRSWVLTGRFNKSDFFIGGKLYLFYLGFEALAYVGYGLDPIGLDRVLDFLYELVISHCWDLAFLFTGMIFGTPLGAMIGFLSGYAWSTLNPKAPDANPEESWPFHFGFLYPLMFIVVVWPVMHQEVVPWIISVLPVADIH